MMPTQNHARLQISEAHSKDIDIVDQWFRGFQRTFIYLRNVNYSTV